MDRDFAAVNQLASNPGVIGRQWAGCYASGRDCGAPPQLGIYNSQGESDSVLGYLLTYGGAVVGGVFGVSEES